ncbi:DNA repair protein Rad26 [Purpureocillium lavendulum]|uniref:DNA repair protein Rad26 n=1 Tax=Purpureocillium lavendulum TaxID=1247861 RepID=A0AB34FV04_9HYPO|nr:DNA repair protein Rad26 [Purpureocillium lavendulum]
MDLDEFSDDGFDDLTDNALQELERNAIQLTQGHALHPSQQQQQQQPSQDAQQNRYSDFGWEEEDDDLDTTEVTNDVGLPIGRPVVDKALQQRPQQHAGSSQVPRRPVPPVPNPRWNPTVDPASRPGPVMAAGARLPNTPAPNQPFPGSQRFPSQGPGGRIAQAQPSQFARPALPPGRFPASQTSQAPPGDMVSALQQRLRTLETELHIARGEVSIIRANSTKAQQEYDAQVARLKKLNAEQLAKQERIVEAAVAAEKSANTELQFLQRDMREVSNRARRKETAGPSAAAGVFTTPKKANKTWGIADGFDEMDIALSPSKGQGRGKGSGSVAANVGERTPSKGKRKRPVMDSPIAALETHTEDVAMGDDKPASQGQHPTVVMTAPTAPFEFLQLVLDHGAFHHQPPTFDTLSHFAFPSDPTGPSFAAMIYEKLPLMGNPHRPMQLLVDFAEHIIAMWTRCLEEQFWEPVKYLVALVSFTFDLHVTSVAPLVVGNLVPVAQSTVLTLAEARRRAPDGNLSNNGEYSYFEEHIDTTQILSLLTLSALACAMTPSDTDAGFESTSNGFWRLMSLDLVLLLLTPRQLYSDILVMLDLLTTSSLAESIGPVTDEAEPAVIARVVIERVSAKLTEPPRATITPEQRRRLRLAALRTLISFARSPFGAMQLACHDNALPRLVTLLSTSIDDLYDQPIPSTAVDPLPRAMTSSSIRLPHSTTSSDLFKIISQSVALIHKLVTSENTSNVADISQKLSMTHGGSQRYLIALGRLFFAEDLIIEHGIEVDVVNAAHELLELAVTPDEGQAVSEAFGA